MGHQGPVSTVEADVVFVFSTIFFLFLPSRCHSAEMCTWGSNVLGPSA